MMMGGTRQMDGGARSLLIRLRENREIAPPPPPPPGGWFSRIRSTRITDHRPITNLPPSTKIRSLLRSEIDDLSTNRLPPASLLASDSVAAHKMNDMYNNTHRERQRLRGSSPQGNQNNAFILSQFPICTNITTSSSVCIRPD
mmetsp:Transcript_7691/g.18968  ORF Transcript_7691/g.18968 Transcript_7691/m.18968 type:complete len:143 (+) Transcript_7691:2-430(+)